ncbi:cyclic diguanylate phosphodiesterase [Sulfurimicrobium lacus]|uniref:Cyclic diguanylate phosphodiesterase n=1 Tax=Sulfurimicrobium lacus TaxID=2715678 RepID=A0A6F8VDD1_9PROT|nr:EAL domain-containing protein [Sulfurimicrobium lacus]BCB27728.1 cyclic diguanylate phosphodiesterase [Sulfurimicrobium lacus]
MFEKIKSLLRPTQPQPSHTAETVESAPHELPPLPQLSPDDKPQPSPYDAKVVDTGDDAPSEAVSSLLDIETNGNRSDAVALRLRFLRREPVLDRAEQLIGYELALRNRHSLADIKPDQTVMLMNDQMLLKSILDLGVERLLQGKRAFVSVTPLILDHPLLERLPSHNIVLALQPQDEFAEQIIARCRQLKEHGFKFALDNPRDQTGLLPWLQMADYVRFNISQIDALELGKVVVAILKMAVRPLIALGVDSEEHFEASRKLAFNYFEGYYFAKPQPSAPHRLDNHRIKVIELLNLVRNHAEIKELEASVKRDAAITYKILRYINSPASGLQQEIRSIAHALTLLGYDQMYRWLTLLLFSGEKSDGRSQVLLKNALVRARLVELLGKENISEEDRDGLFLVGILSLLDVLLNVPMETALTNFHLPSPVSQALLEHEGIYAPYLDLAMACEEFDQEQIGLLASACGLTAAQVNAAHVDALVWAEDVEK